MKLPLMNSVVQHFPGTTLGNVQEAVREQLSNAGLNAAINPGARIAVTGGSRGIANIPEITRSVVDCVKDAGGHPFILPAMGSHGGSTPEGQKEVLASYGIAPETMGVPVEATMDVVEIGRLEDSTPVLINRLAVEADGVIIVNRIKPHTSFRGRYESGLMKMMTIGLGSRQGASTAHARGANGLANLIPAWGRTILEQCPILFGVAIVENAQEQTSRIAALRPDQFELEEPRLLLEARENMPRLWVQGIDLLIVEEMGKNISGTGMDTNVIGRMMLPGVKEPDEPGISRIVVLDLSDRTHGNANGVGMADIITRRLFEKIDLKATYANVFTTTFLNRAYIPIIADSDQEAIEVAIEIQRLDDPTKARIARIRNTMEITRIQLSEPLLHDFQSHPHLEALGDPVPFCFGRDGVLI